MKHKIFCLLTLLVSWTAAFVPLRAAETSQTIALRGCDATLTGTADLRLRLFDAAAGGNMVFEETQAGVAVDATNCVTVGIGNVTPLAAGLFIANPSLWAAFALDATPDTELGAGRTPITANGYAFRAANADNAATFSAGAAVTGSLRGALLTLNNTGQGAQGLIISASQTGLIATSQALGVSGETDFGTGVRGKGFLGVEGRTDVTDGTGVAGVATDLTSKTYGVAGQISSTNGLAAGVLGTSNALTGTAPGVWGQTNSSSTNATGVFGLANAASGATVGVWGRTVSSSDGGAGIFGETTATTGNSAGVWGRTSSTSSLAAGVFGESRATTGLTYGVYGRSVSTSPFAAGVVGESQAGGQSAGVRGVSTAVDGNGVIGDANNGTGAYAIWGRSTSGFAGMFDGKIQVNGMTTTRVLQITGGADLSEKFEVGGADSSVAPGMVVAIDPANPGKLVVSRQAYNQAVAGIISGAGGIQTGMLMGQSGSLADGEHAVALTGRVYVWADASNGAIVPGNFLTTSDRPGHAMKVTDYAQAQGAILGKAMTGLSEGQGLVLVLVTLQ